MIEDQTWMDEALKAKTEEVEVCPARSRTQAWSELCAQYTKDFKRELDDKRRRVDAFDAGVYFTHGETDKTEETNGGEPSAATSLRPEEWYVAEMLAFEETKRRHQKLQAEVRRSSNHAEREFAQHLLAQRLARRGRFGSPPPL